ncbi:MAG: GC-type dockerin domain-anchored protein [Planctomycetota bacterium]
MSWTPSKAVATILAIGCTAAAASAQFSIDWYTIDSGGGISEGGGFTLYGTIGQHDAGEPMTGGGFTLTPGFWAGAITSGPACPGDLTTTGATLAGLPGFGVPDGIADLDDLGYYINAFVTNDLDRGDLTTSGATLEGQPGFGNPDGVLDLDDLGYFIGVWLAGCP